MINFDDLGILNPQFYIDVLSTFSTGKCTITMPTCFLIQPTCFLIQPFDSGKFDSRCDETYKPALTEAGLKPYRVDEDLGTEIPIESIEDGIRNATICFADITTNNPNVWYELGYAFATGRPVIMVCENVRERFPFDIQHRRVIQYKSESESDFTNLKNQITETAKALIKNHAVLRQISETEQIASIEGLGQHEILVLAILAEDTAIPEYSKTVSRLKRESELSGLTSIGFGIAFRRLLEKGFVVDFQQEDQGYYCDAARITKPGWDWIDRNQSLFVLKTGKNNLSETTPYDSFDEAPTEPDGDD